MKFKTILEIYQNKNRSDSMETDDSEENKLANQ